MDYEQIATAYPDNRVDNIKHENGVVDTLPRLTTNLPPQDIIKNIRDRIRDSIDYWDDMQGFNLRYARAQSERMLLGKQIDVSKLYRYSIPYIENEIHVAVDTIISYVSASTPKVEVWPHEDTEEAKMLAKDLNMAINAHSEKFNLSQLFEQLVRDVLVNRVGIIKLVYDEDKGPNGEIVPLVINPQWVVVDKNALLNGNPDFIAEAHKESIEKIIERYPKKKKEIFTQLGIKRGTKSQLSQEIVWWEVHATVYKKYGQRPDEMVFEFMEDVMLDQFKDLNWIYDGDGGRTRNFLDEHLKPYIPLNYLNDGTHWIDKTTPIEQAYSMQDVLNKRGRQIMQNADTANGILAFSSEGITADDVENLVGDPNQKFMIATNGRPIGDYVMQIEPHMLPDYVLDDKIDLRSTIKTLMATPSQMIGSNQSEAGKDETATESLMIKGQASQRLDRLVRAVEFTAKNYFNFLVQMMSVHYTEKHWFVYNSGDGDFDYVALDRKSIDTGMHIGVSAGSSLPYDKSKNQTISMNLAKMGLISPLDLYKDLDLDQPQQRYENWVAFKTNPMELSRDAETAKQDSSALAEYLSIMGGAKDVKPDEDADESHIMTHRKQLISSDFLKADRKKQSELLDLIEKEINSYELRQALTNVGMEEAGQSAPNPQQAPAPPAGPMGTPSLGAVSPAQPQPMPMGQPMPAGSQISPGVMQLVNSLTSQVPRSEGTQLSQILGPEINPIVDLTDPNKLNIV